MIVKSYEGNMLIDVTEQIARMDQKQRDDFVHNFVSKWPELANEIKESIQIEIFEQRELKEKQELEEISRKAREEDTPLVLTKDMEIK
tara:strand:- start:1748 stop:2011 length:264 start_codon:yes stop_codon:yes gene_type:complete